MRGRKSRILLSVLVGFLTSCAPKVVGIYNSEVLKSTPTSFHVYSTDEVKALSEEEQEFDQKLTSVIVKNLLSKGLIESSLPDLYISYMISVHSSEETNEANPNRYDRYRYNNYSYNDPMRMDTRSYKQGVLIIDIKNDDNKLVWQGSMSFKLSSKKSSKEELLLTCQEIIGSFEPPQLN